MSKGKFFMSNHHFPGEISLPQIQINQCAFEKIRFWDYPDSRFRHWCFYWNATAGAHLLSQGKEIELDPEKAVLIPPYTSFSSRMTCEFEHFYIHFSLHGVLEQPKREIILLDGTFAAEKIPELLKKTGIFLFFDIQALLGEAFRQIPPGSFFSDGKENMDNRIRKVLEAMYEHIGTPADNIEFSSIAGMGKNEFYKLFKEEMHMTPRQYFLMLRISHAARLLRHSAFSIEEIAEQCGFADRYHFSKAFRKNFQIPPAEYRSKHE